MISQAFKDLARLREISLVALRHGFGELVDRARLWDVLGRREKQEVSPESQRASTSRRFRLFLSELGPTFVKLGQILSTRADLLPAEYIAELSLLQDAVPPEPMSHVLEEIERSLGHPASELFESIEETALASASIAQVHRARTKAGDEVVVKVQRSAITERMRADLDLLYYAARSIEAVVEETGVYTPVGIIEEFDAALQEELDFTREASNLKEFARLNEKRPYLRLPRVFEELSSRTVLTMEFLKGEKIRTIDLARHDRKVIAQRLIEGAFRQLFEDGAFHGDPHPGNILVMEGDALGLLDLGIVGRMTKQMQENLILLVLAVSLKDAQTVARLLYRIATPDRRTNLAAFTAEIQSVLDQYLQSATTLGSIDAKQLMPELLDLAVKYHVRIPKEYALLSRASIAVEGLLRWLHPEINIGQAVMPYAKELLVGRYEGTGLGTTGMRALLRFQTFATDVPMQLSQVLLDLESGKFKVNVASEDLQQINLSIKALGPITFLGFLACGLTIGGMVSFSRLDVTVLGIPVLGVLSALAIAGLFGTAMFWTLLVGRLRKVSVSRWIKRLR